MISDEPKPAKRKINIELLLGLSATFLSLAALIVTIFQTKIAREQQHASVWPRLSVTGTQKTGEYIFGLDNRGIGPAIIKEVEWQYGNKSFKSSREFFWSWFGPNKIGVGYSEIGNGNVFKSGDNMTLIGIWENDSLAAQLRQKVESDSFNLRVIYSDVYGNCWQLDHEKTQQLSDCAE